MKNIDKWSKLRITTTKWRSSSQKTPEVLPSKYHRWEFLTFDFKKSFNKFSSNIAEVTRTVLNFLFFCDKISQAQRSTNPLTANKNKKNMYKKHLTGKKLIIRYLRFILLLSCTFMLFVLFVLLVLLVLFCAFLCLWNLIIKKMFKIVLVTLAMLLLMV